MEGPDGTDVTFAGRELVVAVEVAVVDEPP